MRSGIKRGDGGLEEMERASRGWYFCHHVGRWRSLEGRGFRRDFYREAFVRVGDLVVMKGIGREARAGGKGYKDIYAGRMTTMCVFVCVCKGIRVSLVSIEKDCRAGFL